MSPGRSIPVLTRIVNAISSARQMSSIDLYKDGLDDVAVYVNLIDSYATLRTL
jgi:hypothetical protein